MTPRRDGRRGVRRDGRTAGAEGAGWNAMRPVIERMQDLDLGTDTVREVGIFESELAPGGSRYTRHASFALSEQEQASATSAVRGS